MHLRILWRTLLALALLLLTLAGKPVQAQPGDDDPLLFDSTEIILDSTDTNTLQIDDSLFTPTGDSNNFGNDVDLDLPNSKSFWSVRNGGNLGLIAEFTALKPSSLDPTLGGDMVIFGGEGYVIFSGWIVGGVGVGAKLYDLDKRYDEFSFGYGGFMVGHEKMMFRELISLQGTVMVGFGGLNMVKKRPDINDPTGNEILERYRKEDFFCFRPAISLGYSPVPILEIRIGANYLLPIGGANVGDLRTLNYGIAVLLGVNY